MCGIAGLLTHDASLPSEEVLRRMGAAIAHRGPDGEGIWSAPGVGLVHRRLAIIDLSPLGAQPMQDVTGRYTITFNGEIYNYRDVRRELELCGAVFRTQSDTEVILAAYQAWGENCVVRLHGMFVFALWDNEQRTLFVARDRVGKKPFFFTRTAEGGLAFASEMKALSTIVPLRAAWQDVRLFLGLQYVPSPRTGFEGVEQLLPGTCASWKNGAWHMRTYHAWPAVGTRATSATIPSDAELLGALEEAVRIRMLAADVPVGAFLSGGVDSAAVVAFASRSVSRPLQTFTMGFDDSAMDERQAARNLARHFGTQHAEFVARPADLLAIAEELIHHYDAPYADSSALPTWLLARETAQQVKVVLTGDGGDEVFGGYRRYVAYDRALRVSRIQVLGRGVARVGRFVARLRRDPRFARMSHTLETLAHTPERAYAELFCASYFATDDVERLANPAFLHETEDSDAVSFIVKQMGGAWDLEAAMRFDLTSYLPDDLNVKMDRASMRFGLEARAPFLDQALVALALRLPLTERVSGGKTKIALKRILRGVVPDEVLHRSKRGFQVPLAAWFRGPLAVAFRERCLDPQGPLASVVRLPEVERLVTENRRGFDYGNRLWMLYSLASWLARHPLSS